MSYYSATVWICKSSGAGVDPYGFHLLRKSVRIFKAQKPMRKGTLQSQNPKHFLLCPVEADTFAVQYWKSLTSHPEFPVMHRCTSSMHKKWKDAQFFGSVSLSCREKTSKIFGKWVKDPWKAKITLISLEVRVPRTLNLQLVGALVGNPWSVLVVWLSQTPGSPENQTVTC